MAGILDTVQRASFSGIDFACETVSVKGGLRDSVHEYLHTDGGQPEIQGRRLYQFDFDAIFMSNMFAYPDAWPDSWDQLRTKFEAGLVQDLVVPTLGTIKAYCVDWPFDIDFRKMRDGVRAKLSFREDQPFNADENVVSPFLHITSSEFVEEIEAAEAQDVLTGAVIEDGGSLLDLFDGIFKLLADVESAKANIELDAAMYVSKLDALIRLTQRVEESTTKLNNPVYWRVARTIRAIGVESIRAKEDALRRLAPMIDFAVPALMSIVDVSISLYGNTSHVMDLLALNRDPPFSDVFAIVPGTVIHAYSPQLEGS